MVQTACKAASRPLRAANCRRNFTPRCEQPAAAALLEELPALDGKLITADPLHCQRGHARTIMAKGGDYRVQVKGNQSKLQAQARKLDALPDTPFLPTAKAATDG